MKKKWNTYILYGILAIVGVIVTAVFNPLWAKIIGIIISIAAIIINIIETKRHLWAEFE